jgi:hypothetical protein
MLINIQESKMTTAFLLKKLLMVDGSGHINDAINGALT